MGSPGRIAMPATTIAATRSASGLLNSWVPICGPRWSSSSPTRVTSRPVAIEIISAGIWLTSPSPTVSRA